MLDHRIRLAQVGSTENRVPTSEADVCLESDRFEAEQITVLNDRCNDLLTRYL